MHQLLRSAWLAYLGGLILFLSIFGVGHVVMSSRTATLGSYVFRNWASSIMVDDSRRLELVAEAQARFISYNDQIKQGHLLAGMVVNRDQEGHPVDVCDSLLFSSLRYVALAKMKLGNDAQEAWEAIEKSQEDGRWFRHPRCKAATSRDMVLGVLAALTQWPARQEQHLGSLINTVGKLNGFVDKGPFYVSYLSPGMGEIVRQLALRSGLRDDVLPPEVRRGFSTVELDAAVLSSGYRSHLVALTAWTEMELQAKNAGMKVRSPHLHFGPLGRLFAAKSIRERRLEWATSRLVEIDPQNIFYRWLRLKAAGALSEGARVKLLEELLAMPQFPRHLPWDCDRRADYLWQRDSSEFAPAKGACNYQYSGVDFLWMSSLIVSDPTPLGRAKGEVETSDVSLAP